MIALAHRRRGCDAGLGRMADPLDKDATAAIPAREDLKAARAATQVLRAGDEMGCPVECLGQAGNTENHNQISQPARAKPERPLLHAGVDACGERDISDLNSNHCQAAAKTGAAHGCQIYR